MRTREAHENLWKLVQQRRAKQELERLAPCVTRLWDGDYSLRGRLAGERELDYEFVENDTGVATVQLSLDHYLSKWVMGHRGREKRNVHITFDKGGSRWDGRLDGYRVVRTDSGDLFLEMTFLHSYEELKHIRVWCNPFLRPELQFPKLWVIFGPAKWCLLVTLFVNILRLETSLWTLPDNPLDPSEWFPFSMNTGKWRNIVKPFPFLADNSGLTLVFSRFGSFHDTAKRILEANQLTITNRRFLRGDPHPFQDLAGELDVPIVEDLFSLIPIRHGCNVWDIQNNAGWGEGVLWGGSLLVGLLRTAYQIGSNGNVEGVDVYHLPEFGAEHYTPGWLGTTPKVPSVIFREGPLTGIKTSEYQYFECTDTSILTGGNSMPGVNESLSALVNIGGDFLTSFINSCLASLGAVGGAIDLPPLGGLIDAVLYPLYSHVFFAFQETPTLRAMELAIPRIPGLEDAIDQINSLITGVGDFHYYEGWADGSDKAFTMSAQLATRTKIHETRQRSASKIEVSDAAPYIFGPRGHGHCWLGDRVCTTVLGSPDPNELVVERITRLKYTQGKDGTKGWKATIGKPDPSDPSLKAMEEVKKVSSVLGQLGIL